MSFKNILIGKNQIGITLTFWVFTLRNVHIYRRFYLKIMAAKAITKYTYFYNYF